eukprot:CAMPEP_0178950914 /NCGR_PEP_ID=MMETSP0789-20121207/6918_1 /TAXON_ID=3005 /ORGANISM="Rhizosolenia setigera, Strain CCMP 1694" /LENGTH=795 /DNA_ID=CAMNT_0020631695 /DNA_START=246 /DNA_END=2633 /DNA_ORIENTATION=+
MERNKKKLTFPSVEIIKQHHQNRPVLTGKWTFNNANENSDEEKKNSELIRNIKKCVETKSKGSSKKTNRSLLKGKWKDVKKPKSLSSLFSPRSSTSNNDSNKTSPSEWKHTKPQEVIYIPSSPSDSESDAKSGADTVTFGHSGRCSRQKSDSVKPIALLDRLESAVGSVSSCEDTAVLTLDTSFISSNVHLTPTRRLKTVDDTENTYQTKESKNSAIMNGTKSPQSHFYHDSSPEDSPSNNHSSTNTINASLDQMVKRLIKSKHIIQAAKALTDRSFIRRRIKCVGIRIGGNSHISDCDLFYKSVVKLQQQQEENQDNLGENHHLQEKTQPEHHSNNMTSRTASTSQQISLSSNNNDQTCAWKDQVPICDYKENLTLGEDDEQKEGLTIVSESTGTFSSSHMSSTVAPSLGSFASHHTLDQESKSSRKSRRKKSLYTICNSLDVKKIIILSLKRYRECVSELLYGFDVDMEEEHNENHENEDNYCFHNNACDDNSLSIMPADDNQVLQDALVTFYDIGKFFFEYDFTNEAISMFHRCKSIRRLLTLSSPRATMQNEIVHATYSRMTVCLGDIEAKRGNLKKSLTLYNKAVSKVSRFITDDDGDDDQSQTSTPIKEEIALVHNKIGDIYGAFGDLTKALGSYELALSLQHQIQQQQQQQQQQRQQQDHQHENLNRSSNVDVDIAETLHNIGVVHRHLDSLDLALIKYKESLSILKQAHEKRKLIREERRNAFNNNSIATSEKNTYYNINERDDFEEDTNEQLNIARTLNNIGSIYRRQGEYEKAIDYFSEEKETIR